MDQRKTSPNDALHVADQVAELQLRVDELQAELEAADVEKKRASAVSDATAARTRAGSNGL